MRIRSRGTSAQVAALRWPGEDRVRRLFVVGAVGFFCGQLPSKCNHLNMLPDSEGPLLPQGGYRYLRSYKVAEAVYDATVVFCRRFIPKSDRDCGKSRRKRIAKQGKQAGEAFWGCSGYPDCKGVRQV